MRLLHQTAGWLAALVLLLWRFTCRHRFVNDPRPALRAAGQPYVMALLHAHQVGAVMANDERVMAAMVSRSADGELLVPALRLRRVLAVRGSTRKAGKDKGGRAALAELGSLLDQRIATLLAVDGPRGPRNQVHRGIADLALQHHAVILPVLAIASRRWFLARTWDRLQIPTPFSLVRVIYAEPVRPAEGEDSDVLRARISAALDALEAEYDPEEHQRAAHLERHQRLSA